jgi:hypothetical protein
MQHQIEAKALNDGKAAYGVLLTHFQTYRNEYAIRFHDELEDLPKISNIENLEVLFQTMEKRRRLFEQLNLLGIIFDPGGVPQNVSHVEKIADTKCRVMEPSQLEG